MKKTLISLLLLFLWISTSSTCAQPHSDSLTFIQAKTNEKVVLTQSMLLEVKTKDGQKLIGEFEGGSETELRVKQKNKTQTLIFSEYQKR